MGNFVNAILDGEPTDRFGAEELQSRLTVAGGGREVAK
jgi:hypothetical protein